MINNNNTETNTKTNKQESNAPVNTWGIAPGELITSLYVLEDEDFTYEQTFGFPVRVSQDGRRVSLYRAYEGEEAYKNGSIIGKNSCYTMPLDGEKIKYRVMISNYALSAFANGSSAGVFRQKDIAHDNPLMVKDSTITAYTDEPLMVKDSTITVPITWVKRLLNILTGNRSDLNLPFPGEEPKMVKDSTITAPDKDTVHVGMVAISELGSWSGVKSFDLV